MQLNKKTLLIQFFVLAIVPLSLFLLIELKVRHGLIWLFLQSLYYYPTFFIFEYEFDVVEPGLLIPTLAGRLITFFIYLLVSCILTQVCFSFRKIKNKSK